MSSYPCSLGFPFTASARSQGDAPQPPGGCAAPERVLLGAGACLSSSGSSLGPFGRRLPGERGAVLGTCCPASFPSRRFDFPRYQPGRAVQGSLGTASLPSSWHDKSGGPSTSYFWKSHLLARPGLRTRDQVCAIWCPERPGFIYSHSQLTASLLPTCGAPGGRHGTHVSFSACISDRRTRSRALARGRWFGFTTVFSWTNCVIAMLSTFFFNL